MPNGNHNMEDAKTLNVAIVGGGPGCKAIIDMIFAEKLHQLHMNLIGVADRNPDAVGLVYAKEKGVFTTQDHRDFYKLENLNLIIELTGHEEVTNQIALTKPEHIRLMDHVCARLFWDVFQIEERMIAEQKLAEEALRKSEEKYGTLVENSLTGIYIDQDGRIVLCNDQFAEIYGYSKAEVVGMESRNLVHPEDRALTNNIRTKRLQGEDVPSEYEARGLTKKGETIWVTRRNTLVDYQGKPAILGNIADITQHKRAEAALRDSMQRLQVAYDQSIMYARQLKAETIERKQAEAALRESQEQYRTVLEASPDPVVVYDMEGKGIYVNHAFTRVFGWTSEEVLGEKMDYVPEENWPETQVMIDKVLAGESFTGVESRRHTKDGHIIYVSISAGIYLDAGGAPAGSIHILRDITERKRVEAALREAHDELERRVEERTAKLARATEQLKLELSERKRVEEALRLAHRDLRVKAADLEAANEELSQYAYVVSHDLKAPLRAIRNYTDFLREDLEDSLEGEQLTYLDGLKRSVRQGEELVGDLLEFSRVGTAVEPKVSIDLGVFLRELIASLSLPPDVEVVMGDEWPTIEVEQSLLRQVLQNLTVNAAKFNTTEHKRIELGCLLMEGGYQLFVRDNGIGIDPRYHDQIFGVFQRLHTREEYEGTGLGLAIVKKAVAKMHGWVRIESEPGLGSTFFIALPSLQKES
jgi:PAS domain S-box-containing protein